MSSSEPQSHAHGSCPSMHLVHIMTPQSAQAFSWGVLIWQCMQVPQTQWGSRPPSSAGMSAGSRSMSKKPRSQRSGCTSSPRGRRLRSEERGTSTRTLSGLPAKLLGRTLPQIDLHTSVLVPGVISSDPLANPGALTRTPPLKMTPPGRQSQIQSSFALLQCLQYITPQVTHDRPSVGRPHASQRCQSAGYGRPR